MLFEFCLDQQRSSVDLSTYPEQQPDSNRGIPKGEPRRISEGTLLDLVVRAPELANIGELEDLLDREEGGDEERLRRKGGWVFIVDVEHIRGGEHAIHLGDEVAPTSRDSAQIDKRDLNGTNTKQAGARYRAVERETPMSASGAVGSFSLLTVVTG